MKSLDNRTVYIGVLIVSAIMAVSVPSRADEAAAKLYQAKCAACHAADGSGNSPVGKTLNLKDLRSPETQRQTDAELTTTIAKGKDKMPAFEKSLKPEEIKSLVAFTRELAGKK